MQRTVRYDGILPNKLNPDGTHAPVTPEDVGNILAWVESHRTKNTPFEIIVEGKTPAKNRPKAKDILIPWVSAGATWWIEALWPPIGEQPNSRDILNRILDGPPSV